MFKLQVQLENNTGLGLFAIPEPSFLVFQNVTFNSAKYNVKIESDPPKTPAF